MRSACYLGWRYITTHRGKTALMVAALALLLLLPTAVTVVIGVYDARLRARAQATPLIVGAKGNRFDLVLQSLFFRDGKTDAVPYGLVSKIEGDTVFDATAVPLQTRYTAGGVPVVGTDLEKYLAFRGLTIDRGEGADLMGEALIGSEAAAALGVGPGDTLTSDRVNIYDISRSMPLKMRVVGVLAPAGNADDRAVFVDVKTTWVIAGLGHGHDPAAHADQASHSAVVTEVQITEDNAALFHFHGEEEDLPLSGLIVSPATSRDRTLLKTRYNSSPLYQALDPAEVMDELMGIVLRAKRFFDANTALVGVAAALLLGLVVALSLKLREQERRTLHKLGCGRWLIVQVQAVELLIVFAAALLIAGAGAVGVLLAAPRVLGV